VLVPPNDAADWVGLSAEPLPVAEALAWTQTDGCGGQVLFTGTVRDHAEGRDGVDWLEYEAYEEQVEPRLRALCAEIRARWPEIGRLVLLHRIGRLELREVAVVVVAGAPHRPEAFAAARFAIDSLKATVPIWKKESWAGGQSWGLEAQHLTEPEASPPSGAAAPSESRA
jgi:molybdopterin synthase catalytic subunit